MPSLIARFLLMAIIALSLPSSTSAFSDVGIFTPYRTAIEALQQSKVIQGYADGTFKPKATINRAEFLKIVLEGRASGSTFEGGNCFPDVTTEWFAKYICTAKKENIVGGYPDGTFKPGNPINFVEAAKILTLAYKQQIQGSSPDWYEPYVRALDSSSAIPLSITGLDMTLLRGDMAEMMWRLREKKEDQPAKAYLNLKYPEIILNLADDTPQQAHACGDLQAFVTEMSRTESRAVMMMEKSLGAPAQTQSVQDDGTTDYSRTNVQVEGVDEGDIVKTDGTYLYAVTGDSIRILRVAPAADMHEASIIDLSPDSFVPTDLYIDGSILVVIGTRSMQGDGPIRIMDKMAPSMIPSWIPQKERSEVRLYDISDRSKPLLKRKVSFEGSLVSTRKIDQRLYIVVESPLRWRSGPLPLNAKVSAESLLPVFSDSNWGTKDYPVSPRCSDVTILPRISSPQYLTIATIPVQSLGKDVKREIILGNADHLYASAENLYLAGTEWHYRWDAGKPSSEERTHLYRFSYDADGVTFKAKGSVPGHLLNQFSMDEHAGTFRVATTIAEVSGQRLSSNNLFVLNAAMEGTGAIEDIAAGERIFAVRFLGNRAYIVTFQKTDPLFVIDTSDPYSPRILGKLKIPGYSDYLHPYDETHLLGFGKEAVEAKEGGFAWYQGMKIALFDVSNVELPVQLHSTVIGDRGTDSPLLHTHKALLFEKDRNLLAFPVSVSILSAEQKKSGASAYGSPVFQGAYVYDFTIKDGFKLRGNISHYTADAFLKAGDHLFGQGRDIERVLRVGESLLTLSQGRVQSNAFSDLSVQGGVEFSKESGGPGFEDQTF